jgi:hypothetical protein
MNRTVVGETTVSSFTKTKSNLFKRHYKKVGIGLLVVLVLLILIQVQVVHKGSNVNSVQQLSSSALVAKINNDMLSKKYKAAINLISKQKCVNTAQCQSLLATVYSNESRDNKALALYALIAKNHQLTQSMAEQAANIAEKVNNNALAVRYFQRAITLSKNNKSDPLAYAEANYDQQQVQSLEGH